MTMARHPADLLSLGFGLFFAAVALALVVGDIEALRLEWIAPVAAVAIGVALILVARPSHTTPDDSTPTA
jgi:hypothetical protein